MGYKSNEPAEQRDEATHRATREPAFDEDRWWGAPQGAAPPRDPTTEGDPFAAGNLCAATGRFMRRLFREEEPLPPSIQPCAGVSMAAFYKPQAGATDGNVPRPT
jgi:hypothetical protein